jgi:hypothetical protein
MTVERVLPLDLSLLKRVGAKRKPAKGPQCGRGSHPLIDAQVVGEVRWLWQHGWSQQRIARRYGELKVAYIRRVCNGEARPTVPAIRPPWFSAESEPTP